MSRVLKGSIAAVASLLIPAIWLFTALIPAKWQYSDFAYIFMWTVALLSSVIAAKLLSKKWYVLTGAWVAIFAAITVIMLTGNFSP